MHKQLDASLARLRTDFVDLYQCHRYDTQTPLEETMRALTEVVEAGKARYVGFSNWTPAQIQAALDLVPDGVVKFVSSQPQYSLLFRGPEDEVFPVCAANGIGQIVWSPLAQGVLTGKYRPGDGPPADSRMASAEMGWAMGRFESDEVLARVQRLVPIAERLGITMAQLALAWVLRRPKVASAIVGASRPEQVRDNAAASGIELDEQTLAEIDVRARLASAAVARTKLRSRKEVVERSVALSEQLRAALAELSWDGDDEHLAEAVWAGEGLGMLLWALELAQLPPYDRPFDAEKLVATELDEAILRPRRRDRARPRDGAALALARTHGRAGGRGRGRPAAGVAVVRPARRRDRDARIRAGPAAAAAARRLPRVRGGLPRARRGAAGRGAPDRLAAPPRPELALRPRQDLGHGPDRHLSAPNATAEA